MKYRTKHHGTQTAIYIEHSIGTHYIYSKSIEINISIHYVISELNSVSDADGLTISAEQVWLIFEVSPYFDRTLKHIEANIIYFQFFTSM